MIVCKLSHRGETENTPKMEYSQLSPCGHLAITDTLLIRTAANSPSEIFFIDVWMKQSSFITDSFYREH